MFPALHARAHDTYLAPYVAPYVSTTSAGHITAGQVAEHVGGGFAHC